MRLTNIQHLVELYLFCTIHAFTASHSTSLAEFLLQFLIEHSFRLIFPGTPITTTTHFGGWTICLCISVDHTFCLSMHLWQEEVTVHKDTRTMHLNSRNVLLGRMCYVWKSMWNGTTKRRSHAEMWTEDMCVRFFFVSVGRWSLDGRDDHQQCVVEGVFIVSPDDVAQWLVDIFYWWRNCTWNIFFKPVDQYRCY